MAGARTGDFTLRRVRAFGTNLVLSLSKLERWTTPAMTVTITFLLRADLRRPDADAALAAVCRLPGVQRAGRVSPRGRHSLARRMCYAELTEDESPDGVRAAVEGVPGVESASVPPARRAL